MHLIRLLWLNFSQIKIKATDIGCFLRVHVRPDLNARFVIARSFNSVHCRSLLEFSMYNLYIENSGRVTRYFLFQRDDDSEVKSEVCIFQSKQSESCVFSVVLVGFLFLGRPTPDSRVLSMTYLAHFPSLSYWVRPELPTLAMAEKHTTGNLRQLMREQVGTYDVKLEDIYGMVARTNQCTVRHTSFLIAVERRDSLTSKPSRMTGCGSLIKSHSIYFANFTLQYREVIRCTVRA